MPVLLLLLALASPAAARPRVSLLPFDSALGFAPEAPRAVQADHPLFGRILLEPAENMPRRVGSLLTPVTSQREFNDALRSTLASANMLAGDPAGARARLRVTWREFELPFRISYSSRATVTVRYELSRIDDGRVIFSRDIATQAEARGGDASIRARGTGRAAILANIASMALCLDRAAYGRAPADCALQPTGAFSAPIVVPRIVYVPR